MKAINIKLATFSFAAMLLVSCSDSNNNDGTTLLPLVNSKIDGSDIESSTDAQELASRVFNYKTSVSTTKTRAFDTNTIKDILDMPKAPTKAEIEADAKDITTKTSDDLSNGKWYLPENKSFEIAGNLNLNNTTIYVEKGAHLTWASGPYTTTAKVVVLEGGEFKTSLDNINQMTEIVSYGSFKFNGSTLLVSKPLYIKGNFDLTGKTLNVQGKCYIGGNLTTTKFSCNYPFLNVKGNMTVKENDNLSIPGGVINVDKTINIGGTININNSAVVNSGCAFETNGEKLNINSGGTLYVKYLKGKKIIESSGANIRLANQSYIECDVFENNNCDNYDWKNTQTNVSTLEGGDTEANPAVAVIKAKKFTFNNGSPIDNTPDNKKFNCFMFRTPGDYAKIVLDGKFYKKDDQTTEIEPYFSGARIYWATDKDNTSDVIINPTECNGGTGWTPTNPDPEPKKPIVPISVIEPDHTHNISATCVQSYSDKMYMSYHARGKDHGSCVEVFQPVDANKQVKLLQYVYDKEGYLDWNHLMVYRKGDTKQIYVVGNHYKKAGTLGFIDIAKGGLLNTEAKTIVTEDGTEKTIKPFQILPLNAKEKATDENCIVYDDVKDRFIVMTTKGYVTYDPETLNELEKVNKAGKAKHVAIGDGKIVTLVFTEQAQYNETDNPEEALKEAINAQLEVRDQSAEMESEPKLTIKTPAVLPHYGKNAIAVKKSKIYVCLGAAGLYCYDINTGENLGHYQMPSPIITDSKNGKNGNYKAYANGCYVGDDGKVYIAYGSYGVVVLKAGTLEKGNPEVLAHVCEGKSANYITVYKDYIYVAYGQKRLQVYQLKAE